MTANDPFASPSRRHVVSGLGAGLVSAQASSVVAETNATSTATQVPPAPGDGLAAVQNPASAYPKPPFPRQRQDPPGLASAMEPPPDHGEYSYRGSGVLAGRRALITGGDSGIGRAVAIAFAREGCDIAFNYLPAEEPDAKEVVKLVEAAGRRAFPLPGDIREEAFCAKLVRDAVGQLGGLDILVNNAGKQVSQETIEDITTEQFDATFRTNVYAPFWITKAALAHLQPGAAIINTASVVAMNLSEHLLDYSQTKAANVAFTKSLAKQLAKRGIRVNAVAPGPYWTPLQPSGGQPEEKIPTFGGDTPLGRPGQPAEIAATYVLLATPASSFMTGELVSNTGGTMPV